MPESSERGIPHGDTEQGLPAGGSVQGNGGAASQEGMPLQPVTLTLVSATGWAWCRHVGIITLLDIVSGARKFAEALLLSV